MNSIVTDIDTRIELPQLERMLHMELDGEDGERLRGLLEQVRSVAVPKAVVRQVKVERADGGALRIQNELFYSRVMINHFGTASTAFAYVATCGNELAMFTQSLPDMLEQYMLQKAEEMLLNRAVAAAKEQILSMFQVKKVASMNPGSLADWPLGEQSKLFGLIGDVHSQIGVLLTDSCLMIPARSVSGIFFPADKDYENCQLCDNLDCPNRRAPFNESAAGLYNL